MSTIAAYLALNRAFLSRSIAFLSLKMVNFALAASLRSSLSDYGLGKSRGLENVHMYFIPTYINQHIQHYHTYC